MINSLKIHSQLRLCVVVSLCLIIASIFGCEKKEEKAYSIAINPWPGYELLYLAGVKGYFAQVGLNIQLEELSSLSDSARAFAAGRVDGFTSTLVEVVFVRLNANIPAQVVLAADYSNGADVIVANKSIPDVASLKGKRVGSEVMGLGLVVLDSALASQGMGVEDVLVTNVEQLNGVGAMDRGQIEAFVTYPPVSVELLKNRERYHQIFSTRETPEQVLDVVSVRAEVLKKDPLFADKLHHAWQLAYQFTKAHPDEAYRIMAGRERMSTEDFKAIFENEVHIFDAYESAKLIKNTEKMRQHAERVCHSLEFLGHPSKGCKSIHDIIFRGEIRLPEGI